MLVTGHTGFKGSWLSLWLADLGAEVRGLSLPPPTTPSLFELARLAERLDHVVGDIRDFETVRGALEAFAPEVVFHLAAQPLVLRSYREPKETFDTNVGGTVNVLEAVRRTPSVAAVVVITSDKCYENREWLYGYREEDPMGGHDPYSASKGATELVVAAYRRSFFAADGLHGGRRVGIASVRAGNVIGGGDFADDRIVPDAVRAVLAKRPLAVRNPRSTRPWQHVLDPLGGYLTLVERLLEDPAGFSEPFNFGPDPTETVDVQRLIERFYAALGKGRFVDASDPKAVHEAKLLHLSCDKAHARLGWRPVFHTEESIERSAAWYRAVVLDGRDARAACRADIQAYERALAAVRGAAAPGARRKTARAKT